MPRTIALSMISLALACGPDVGATQDGTSTGAMNLTSTTGSSSEAAPTSDGTTAELTTAELTTAETTTAESTTRGSTSEAASATGSVTTGEPGTTTEFTSGEASTDTSTGEFIPLETRAWWVDGMQLQLRVIQRDPDAGLCRGVFLEWSPDVDLKYEQVVTPEPWFIRFVWVKEDVGECFDPYTWYEGGDFASADSASGSVTFHDVDPNTGKPADLDIDVTGVHPPKGAWTPAVDALTAFSVPVQPG